MLLAGLVTGCRPSFVDGWSVGPAVECGSDAECVARLDRAIAEFERRDPGHPTITSVALHDQGRQENGQTLIGTGFWFQIALFKLADGSTHAIAVGYVGVSRTPQIFDESMQHPRPAS